MIKKKNYKKFAHEYRNFEIEYLKFWNIEIFSLTIFVEMSGCYNTEDVGKIEWE